MTLVSIIVNRERLIYAAATAAASRSEIRICRFAGSLCLTNKNTLTSSEHAPRTIHILDVASV
ncbi:hypothetical protein D3C80_1987210 [compost metagenome]